jgi:predicted component of type VI protein secretion system
MPDAAAHPLSDLVASWLDRVNELRRAGKPAELLAAAKAAADEIEGRIKAKSDEDREALTTVKSLMFNAAADCWPGWSVPDEPPDTRVLVTALELAQRSVRLVKNLSLGDLREGTGTWLRGALELALGRYTNAANNFAVAREHYIAAKAPGLALLAEGYIAIVRQIALPAAPAAGEDLDQVCSRIASGDFKDGAAWIEQLRTALKAFKAIRQETIRRGLPNGIASS